MNKIVIAVLTFFMFGFIIGGFPLINPSLLLDGSYIVVNQPGGDTKGILVDSLNNQFEVEYKLDELQEPDSVFADTLNPLTSEVKVWADLNISVRDKQRGAIVSYSIFPNMREFVWKYEINSQDNTLFNFLLIEKKERSANTLFVSKTFGNNNWAFRDYKDLKFKTPWTAAQNAESGDVVQIEGNESYTIGAISSGSDYEYLTTSEVSLLRSGINSVKIKGNENSVSSTLADPVFFNITTSGKSVEVKDLNFNKCSFKNCILTGSSVVFDRCNFTTSDTSAIKFVNTLSDTTGFIVFKNCTFTSTHAAASPIYYSASSTVRVFFYNCTFVGKNGVVEIKSNGTVTANKLYFDACRTNSITNNVSVTYSGSPLTRNYALK